MTPEEKKFQNYSHASKLRQSIIPKEIRKARAAAAANARWATKTIEERRAHSKKMIDAKQFGRLRTRSSTSVAQNTVQNQNEIKTE